MNDSNATYEYTQKLQNLLSIECNLHSNFRGVLNNCARKLLHDRNLVDSAEDFLCDDLDVDLHKQDDIKTLVRSIPKALSNEYLGVLPIFWIPCGKIRNAPFIPILAEEVTRLEINRGGNGNGARGALTSRGFEGRSAIQLLCRANNHLDTLIKLREMDLLQKGDIRRHALLRHCHPDLFAYFAEWDKRAMRDWTSMDDMKNGTPLNHVFVDFYKAKLRLASRGRHRERREKLVLGYKNELSARIRASLTAGMRYYPSKLGFVNEPDHEGVYLCDRCGDILGRREMWDVVQYSIIHSGNDAIFVQRRNKENQSVKDEDDDLNLSFSPLLVAAVESNGDYATDIIFHLLRQDPAQWIPANAPASALEMENLIEQNERLKEKNSGTSDSRNYNGRKRRSCEELLVPQGFSKKLVTTLNK